MMMVMLSCDGVCVLVLVVHGVCLPVYGPQATVLDVMGGGNGVLSILNRQVAKRVRSFTFITMNCG